VPPAGPKAIKAAAPAEWRLELAKGGTLRLKQGLNLNLEGDQIFASKKDDGEGTHFARVAMRAKKMRLINDSEYVWSVSVNGKKSRIKNGDDVELGTAQIDITFFKGVTGTITPVESPASSSPADDPGNPSDQSQPEIK
jgi:hypothetical protein